MNGIIKLLQEVLCCCVHEWGANTIIKLYTIRPFYYSFVAWRILWQIEIHIHCVVTSNDLNSGCLQLLLTLRLLWIISNDDGKMHSQWLSVVLGMRREMNSET